MSDKHYVGLDLVSLEDKKKMRPVSRVTFLLDNGNSVTAGDDTGREIAASNPHATQEMANAVLARLKGYQYHAFEAGNANLDPAAELGDGITAGGMYGFIGRLNDDGNGYPGVDASGEAELEDEYPSAGPMTQEFNRKLAQTRSSITKTAEEIRLEVAGVDSQVSALAVTLDGVTITDPSGQTRIKGSSVDTGSLAANSITADKLNIKGSISFADLEQDVVEHIASGINQAQAKTLINSTLVSSPTLIGAEIYFGNSGASGNLCYTTGYDGQRTTDLIQLGSTSGMEIAASTNIRISPGGHIFLDVELDELWVRSGGVWTKIREALKA